jgi:hypothetical protein
MKWLPIALQASSSRSKGSSYCKKTTVRISLLRDLLFYLCGDLLGDGVDRLCEVTNIAGGDSYEGRRDGES